MKRKIFKEKWYPHFDIKKHFEKYEKWIKNADWVAKHGFYPFIHYVMDLDKYKKDENGVRNLVPKKRDIFYASHIDRYIYQYYAKCLNDRYNLYAKNAGINTAVIAYRDIIKGKCNIDFAKEVFEFIAKHGCAYVFVGDFSSFFDNLDHAYLKNKLKNVYGTESLGAAEYAVFKSVTRYSYIELSDINDRMEELGKGDNVDKKKVEKYFSTEEFHHFKGAALKRNCESFGIPQGSPISAVYANVYMVDFDKMLNDYVTLRKGLYRRYCDDIAIVIPMSAAEFSIEAFYDIVNKVDDIRSRIPRLGLNLDKTGKFVYMQGSFESLASDRHVMSYLGFDFDGKCVSIRDKSLFKYYRRAYKKAKGVKFLKKMSFVDENYEKAYNAGRKALYKAYTHLGVSKNPYKYGNFLSYAYKAHRIFSSSNLLESNIRRQIRRHWQKIEQRLK